MTQRVSYEMVEYISRQAVHAIRTDSDSSTQELAAVTALRDFIVHLVKAGHVHVSTLLTTLIYLGRLRSKLPVIAKGALTSLPNLARI